MNGHINHSSQMLRPTWQAVYCDANKSELLALNKMSQAKSSRMRKKNEKTGGCKFCLDDF